MVCGWCSRRHQWICRRSRCGRGVQIYSQIGTSSTPIICCSFSVRNFRFLTWFCATGWSSCRLDVFRRGWLRIIEECAESWEGMDSEMDWWKGWDFIQPNYLMTSSQAMNVYKNYTLTLGWFCFLFSKFVNWFEPSFAMSCINLQQVQRQSKIVIIPYCATCYQIPEPPSWSLIPASNNSLEIDTDRGEQCVHPGCSLTLPSSFVWAWQLQSADSEVQCGQ